MPYLTKLSLSVAAFYCKLTLNFAVLDCKLSLNVAAFYCKLTLNFAVLDCKLSLNAAALILPTCIFQHSNILAIS